MMQKELIIQKLRERGCRITKQRLMLLDIILEEDCSCCKEIYYKASKVDKKIGSATVYRMINTLEEIGAINRKNMYKISGNLECDGANCSMEDMCTIKLEDGTVIELSNQKWKQVLQAGLNAIGYVNARHIRSIETRPC